METTVTAGWIKVDRIPVISGLYIGPDEIKGKSKSGGLMYGVAYNLLVQDIVFHGLGDNALAAALATMQKFTETYVNCGIREGMMVEKEVESEYGPSGGLDQIRVPATEKDILRIPYYVQIYIPDETFTFNSLVKNLGAGVVGFIPATGLGGKIREIMEALGTLYENLPETKTKLDKYKKTKNIVILLSGKEREYGDVVYWDKYTRRISTIANIIIEEFNVEKIKIP